jgi:N-acyl-D-aspartate/D-glutamate deacylase
MAFDVLIRGGQVIDGSANVGFRAAVGIAGDTVSILRGGARPPGGVPDNPAALRLCDQIYPAARSVSA